MRKIAGFTEGQLGFVAVSFSGHLTAPCRISQHNTYQHLLADMKVEEVLSDARGVCKMHAPLFQTCGERYRYESLRRSLFVFFQDARPKGVDMMSVPFCSTIPRFGRL
jgi:hypothetical protein